MTKLRMLGGPLRVMRSSMIRVPTNERERDAARRDRPWRKWYKTERWRRLRIATFVRDHFTCQWPGCGRVEGNTSKLVADHRRPHRGDERMFWDEDNLQTLCKPCHDGAKQREEARHHH